MLTMRRSNERGHFKNNWLDSFHSFSFGEYFDQEHMHYRDLRVINQDVVAGAAGFPMHGHRDMEIITYMLRGTLEHKDSMGNKAQIKAGEIQVMSAGTGVMHSEYNPNSKEPAELLQIWVVPSDRGFTPGYNQKMFSAEDKKNNLLLIASGDGEKGSMKINQDTRLFASVFDAGFEKTYEPRAGRGTWIQVARGSLFVNGQLVDAGDGVAVEQEKAIALRGSDKGAEFILFDLK